MLKSRSKVIAAAMMLGVVGTSASADLIIDTIPEWDGQRSNVWDKIAQTLIVPVDKPILNTFEVGVGADVEGRTFHLRIYEWDRDVEHTVGGELFSSGPFGAPVGTVDFTQFGIGIPLAGGTEYAVIVDWDQGGSGNGVAFLSDSSYTDGYANFTLGPFDETWLFNQNSGFDMAFRAVFIPAPGALSLLGIAGLMGTRRRRR